MTVIVPTLNVNAIRFIWLLSGAGPPIKRSYCRIGFWQSCRWMAKSWTFQNIQNAMHRRQKSFFADGYSRNPMFLKYSNGDTGKSEKQPDVFSKTAGTLCRAEYRHWIPTLRLCCRLRLQIEWGRRSAILAGINPAPAVLERSIKNAVDIVE